MVGGPPGLVRPAARIGAAEASLSGAMRSSTPRPAAILREVAPAIELVRPTAPASPAEPLAGRQPVLLVPGFLAGDGSLEALAAHLRRAGHAPVPSGISKNVDCSERTARRLEARLDAVAAAVGRRVVVVGHSRGGMLARVVARRRPELVAGVVTLASPHRSPLAVHPVLWGQLAMLVTAGTLGVRGVVSLSCATGRCCSPFRDDLAGALPPDVDRLSLFSRTDGVVDWRACLDTAGRNVEVITTHCGMVRHRPTLHLVTDAVTRFADATRPAAPAAPLAAAA